MELHEMSGLDRLTDYCLNHWKYPFTGGVCLATCRR
jgi:hypothetical protein